MYEFQDLTPISGQISKFQEFQDNAQACVLFKSFSQPIKHFEYRSNTLQTYASWCVAFLNVSIVARIRSVSGGIPTSLFFARIAFCFASS